MLKGFASIEINKNDLKVISDYIIITRVSQVKNNVTFKSGKHYTHYGILM